MKVVSEIILIDDDDEDRWLLIKALNEINSCFLIKEFFDGEIENKNGITIHRGIQR